MANYGRDIKNAAQSTERHAASIAGSATHSAASNAATARAAQSAATGAWVGAGFQAVTAFQTARAARAVEEQLALQHAMADRQLEAHEQATWHQFAIWRQTAEGAAFLDWRVRAFKLSQFLRNRDSEWLQAWANAIGRAQAETPEAEKQRVLRQPARLKQTGLKVMVILSFAAAAVFGLSLIFQSFARSLSEATASPDDFTYENCLEILKDPENFIMSEADCEAINPQATRAILQVAVPLVLFVVLGIVLLVLRGMKMRAARTDNTLETEARARSSRWGFDPLAVAPGYIAFNWYQSQNVNGYADRLMNLALYEGHGRPPSQSELITLVDPQVWPPSDAHPAEANAALTRFQQVRPVLGS